MLLWLSSPQNTFLEIAQLLDMNEFSKKKGNKDNSTRKA